MKDPESVLQKPGPNAQHASTIIFSAADQVVEMQDTIQTYLYEAKGHATAGLKPPEIERDIEILDELVDAMDADRELAEAFHALTPVGSKAMLSVLIQPRNWKRAFRE